LTHLGARDVASTPLPMGHGFVTAQHGRLPLPAPATVMCLQGAPTHAVPVEGELVTPTGAAIIATIAKRWLRWPSMVPEQVGFGAGQKQWPDRPNLLRVVLGSADNAEHQTPPQYTHVMLEANVDDMTGEFAAHAIAQLLAAGALDAWASPITMKKGRPALTISALAENAMADHVAATMLRETTTIGLRRHGVTRDRRPRRSVRVETRFGPIDIKVSEGIEPARVKAEFGQCAAAAKLHAVTAGEVVAAAHQAYRQLSSDSE